MRPLLLRCLCIMAFAVSACKSSTEANGAYFDYKSVPPNAGLKFVCVEQESLGEPGGRCDYDVTSADTTPLDRTYACHFAMTSYQHYGPLISVPAIRYLETGDVEIVPRRNSGPLWTRLPIATDVEWRSVIDSTINDTADNPVYHLFDTVSVRKVEVSDTIIAGTSLKTATVVCKYTEVYVDLRSGDTAITQGTRTMQYAPSIGFFTRIDDVESHNEPISTSSHYYRMTLKRYELK
jgi:hypothetical protein